MHIINVEMVLRVKESRNIVPSLYAVSHTAGRFLTLLCSAFILGVFIGLN